MITVRLIIEGGEVADVELADDVLVKTIVTREATYQGRSVEVRAWGLMPAPFLVLKYGRAKGGGRGR